MLDGYGTHSRNNNEEEAQMSATRDYTLGKGKVLFQPDGQTAFMDLGNAPAFTISVSIDKLEHFSSRSGLSTKDLEVITKLGMGGSFTLDEPKPDNLRMFVMAASNTAADQGAAALGAVDDVVLPATGALGKWYPLQNTASGAKTNGAVVPYANNIGTGVLTLTGTQTANAAHSYVVRVTAEGASGAMEVKAKMDGGAWSTTPIVVTDGVNFDVKYAADVDSGLNAQINTCANCQEGDEFTFAVIYTAGGVTRVYNIDSVVAAASSVTVVIGGVTKTEGVDGVGHYQVDRKAGLIYINETQPASPIAAGNTLDISVKLLIGTKTSSSGGTLTSLKGKLYFVGDPPQGRVIDIQGYCSLTPNGDFSLIGTDWMQMQFSVEFLEQPGVSGLIQLEDRGKIG